MFNDTSVMKVTAAETVRSIANVHGITLELYQQHSEEIQLANQYGTDLKV